MLLVDRHSGTATPGSPSDSSSAMQLRFRADGRIVDLPLGKTTIGSSPRCTLRIERPGIAPVHCLIVRDADRLVVRRWSADSRLNGAPFEEASLEVGDCLTLAGEDFELVGPPSMIESPTPSAEASVDNADALLMDEQLLAAGGSDLSSDDGGSAAEAIAPDFEVAPTPEQNTSLSVNEAAEFVFRQLQTACQNSRGRSRKLLAALRDERHLNQDLTRRLAEARDDLVALNRERIDWEQSQREPAGTQGNLEVEIQCLRREIAELEGRLADHTRQMTEIQSQLATRQTATPSVAAVVDHARLSHMAEVDAAQVDPWNPPAETSPAWDDVLEPSSDQVESVGGDWDQSVVESNRPDEFFGGECLSQEVEVEAPAWAGQDVASNPDNSNSDDSPFDDVSIWNRDSARDALPEGEAFESVTSANSPAAVPNPWVLPHVAADADLHESPAAPAKLPPTSYIERFSHMFADEVAGEPLPVKTGSVPAAESIVAKPRNMGIVGNERASEITSGSDNEESIEQYMAKLLQRVRGDSPAGAAAVQAAATEAKIEIPAVMSAAPAVPPVQTTTQPTSSAATAPNEVADEDSDEEVEEVSVNWDAITQRLAAPTTDLGALRALANESARRAIGHHALKKHRRDAVTKVIVSMLAGMTSLWLMLDAPNWRDIQFIVACVSLVVAAYWAGEAGRELLESFRAAAYDGPDARHDAIVSYDQTALPIDVDASR